MQIRVIRSNRKTMAIQISPDLTVTVRAPMRATQRDIDRILREKEAWIQKHLAELEKKKAQYEEAKPSPLTEKDIRDLADKALRYIPGRVEYFSKQIGVSYGNITIRNQKTRWGSCSSRGNLNFNCLLMLTSPEIIDYVVVHELCHRKEMNHSAGFWSEVGKVLPNYKSYEKWLRDNGAVIMRRVR